MRLTQLALSLVVSATVLSGAVPTPAEEKDVMAAMDAWIQAVNRQDVPALRKILHDELIFSHSDARTQNKQEVLADVQAGRGAAGVELSETIVRVYGITALVKARVHVRGRPRPDGSAPPPTGRPPNIISVMHVLVKGPMGWQLVSRQATRPPAGPGAAADAPVRAQQGQEPGPGGALPVVPEDLSAYQCTHYDGPACDEHPAPAPNNPLVGSWIRVSLLRNSFSQQPPSAPMYLKLGSDGYWSMMEFPAGRPKVKKLLLQQTPEELRTRFDWLEGGYGTYSVQGQMLDRRHAGELNPGGALATVLLTAAGSQIREWRFEGNIMAMIGPGPTRSPQARMRRLPPQRLGSTALVGTWERTTLAVNGQAVSGPLLQQWILLGEDGWFHQTSAPPGRRNPKKPMEEYTVQDFVDGYTGVSAVRGLYDVNGTTLTRRHVADLDPNLTGWDEIGQFTLSDRTLTIESSTPAGEKARATYTRLPPIDPYAPTK